MLPLSIEPHRLHRFGAQEKRALKRFLSRELTSREDLLRARAGFTSRPSLSSDLTQPTDNAACTPGNVYHRRTGRVKECLTANDVPCLLENDVLSFLKCLSIVFLDFFSFSGLAPLVGCAQSLRGPHDEGSPAARLDLPCGASRLSEPAPLLILEGTR